MNLCKNYAKRFPILIVILTLFFAYALLYCTSLFPEGPLALGISEVFMAAAIFCWTLLFMGREKVCFHKDGFGYAFRFFKGYLIVLTVFCVLTLAISIPGREITANVPLNVLNVLLASAAVGIVEEFTFRGLVFGGILQKIGNSKKNIITAAVISGLLFGAMHVIGSVIAGEISSLDTMLTAALKIFQSGVFGVILALIYYKTRNLYAIAVIHGLNDLILFLGTVIVQESDKSDSYVGSAGHTTGTVVSYVIFTLIMIPMLVKSIRNIQEKEAIPFDDDFYPRAVAYKRVSKGETL